MEYEVRIRRSGAQLPQQIWICPPIGVSRLPSKGSRKSHLRETFDHRQDRPASTGCGSVGVASSSTSTTSRKLSSWTPSVHVATSTNRGPPFGQYGMRMWLVLHGANNPVCPDPTRLPPAPRCGAVCTAGRLGAEFIARGLDRRHRKRPGDARRPADRLSDGAVVAGQSHTHHCRADA